MDDKLEIEHSDKTLYLKDKVTEQIIAQHRPFGTAFDEYRRVRTNCNIIKEIENGFPTDKDGCRANIYCLDDNFKIKWTIKLPMDNDGFPNPIQWDKEVIEVKTPDGYLTIDIVDNPDTFTCASWRGFTVTAFYETGQHKNVEFTK